MTEKTIVTKPNFKSEVSPSALLVQMADRYESKIYFLQENGHINAKSIMGMMTMRFDAGQELTIQADGRDEARAVEELAAFLTGNN